MTEYSLELWGLFLSAFISSTIAPGGSEAVLAVLLASGRAAPAELVTIASLGNTLGAFTTWWLGWYASARFGRNQEIATKKQRAVSIVQQYGVWSLLFSWLPVIGDGLCFAAGWLKFPFLLGAMAILVGKVGRYAVIAVFFAG